MYTHTHTHTHTYESFGTKYTNTHNASYFGTTFACNNKSISLCNRVFVCPNKLIMGIVKDNTYHLVEGKTVTFIAHKSIWQMFW